MSRAHEGLLIDGLDDWNQAAWLVAELCLEGAHSELTLAEVQEVVLDAIHRLVSGGLVEVGDIEEVGEQLDFVAWTGTADELIARARQDWVSLGRLPNLDELFWISNTPLGDEIARRALDRDG